MLMTEIPRSLRYFVFLSTWGCLNLFSDPRQSQAPSAALAILSRPMTIIVRLQIDLLQKLYCLIDLLSNSRIIWFLFSIRLKAIAFILHCFQSSSSSLICSIYLHPNFYENGILNANFYYDWVIPLFTYLS